MSSIIQIAQLIEAGKVLSAANVADIQAALNALRTVINRATGATPTAEDNAAEAVTEESMRRGLAMLTEALSHNDIRARLADGLRQLHPPAAERGSGTYVWVRDVYDAAVVYEIDRSDSTDVGTFQRAYTMTGAGAVAFGDPVAVMQRTEWVPIAPIITESASSLTSTIVPLIEKSVRKDNTISMKIIEPGWGSSGFYPAAVLERDGPKVFKSGLHMFVDHPTETEAREKPERSVRDIAAVLTSDAIWQEKGSHGPGLYADARVAAPFREVLDDIAPHIGVSIRAAGTVKHGEADGQSGNIVESLVSAHSVDFVTVPGAGGAITSLVESARARRAAPAAREEPDMTDATTLQEAQTQIATLQEQVRHLRERDVLREAREQVRTALASTDLHALTQTRLTESLVRVAPVTDAGALDTATFQTAIDAAITEARTEYAAVVGTGRVTDMGGPPAVTATPEESTARLNEAMARLNKSTVAQA